MVLRELGYSVAVMGYRAEIQRVQDGAYRRLERLRALQRGGRLTAAAAVRNFQAYFARQQPGLTRWCERVSAAQAEARRGRGDAAGGDG